MFLCKDRSGDCSPETSLKQLRLKRDPGIDGVGEISSQLMFTISQVTPLHSGTYQCCARSQKSGIRLQGHFFSILFTGESQILLMPPGGTVSRVDSGDVTRWFRSWKGSFLLPQSFSNIPIGRCCLSSKRTHKHNLILSLILKLLLGVAIAFLLTGRW